MKLLVLSDTHCDLRKIKETTKIINQSILGEVNIGVVITLGDMLTHELKLLKDSINSKNKNIKFIGVEINKSPDEFVNNTPLVKNIMEIITL